MALFAVFVPVAVGAGVVALGRTSGGRGGAWLGASAVGLAYAAGHAAVTRPIFPPVEVTDRLPWLAVAASALAVFEAAVRPGRVVKSVGRTLLAAQTLGMVLGPVVVAGDLSRQVALWLAASAGAAVAAWLNLEALAAHPRGSDLLRGLILTAAGAAVVLLLSGTAVLGLLGLAVVAALCGGWLASRGLPPEGYVPAAAAVLVALVLEGYVYASVPAPCALLLAAAPGATWVARLGPSRRLGPWALAILGAVAVLIPVGVAVGLAIYWSPASEY